MSQLMNRTKLNIIIFRWVVIVKINVHYPIIKLIKYLLIRVNKSFWLSTQTNFVTIICIIDKNCRYLENDKFLTYGQT